MIKYNWNYIFGLLFMLQFNLNASPVHFSDSIKLINRNISDSAFITLSDVAVTNFLNNNQPEQALIFIEAQYQQFKNIAKRKQQLIKLKAKVNYRNKNYALANALADSLLKLMPDTIQIIDAYRIKGQVCFKADDYLNAIENFLNARNLILNSNNKNGLDDVLGNLASCYQTIGLLPTALAYAQEALITSRQTNDTASMCNAYLNLGNINKDIAERDEAEKYYMAGLALAKQFIDKQVLVYLYSAMGTIEREKGNTTTALQHQLNALNEAQSISNNHLIAGILNNIANTLLDAGKTAEGKAYFLKANDLAKQTADIRNLALTNISLGFLATEEKEYTLSNVYLQKALKYSKQINHLDFISQAMIGMYDNYKALNNPKQALYYYEMYNVYHDSIINDQNKIKINRLKTKFAVAEKEHELMQKRAAESAIAAVELKKQRLIRNYTIAMALLLVILIVFIGLRYKERTNHNKALVEKNQIIEASYATLQATQNELVLTEKQREAQSVRVRIARDIHDELGAGLTKITLLSGLLRKKFEANDVETKNQLQRIIENSKGVSASLNEIVWAVNPMNDSSDSLISYLKVYAHRYLEDANFDYDLHFPEDISMLQINPELKRNVFLVLKEALNNAVKYANANRVVVSFELNKNKFKLLINDNGKGFDQKELTIRQSGASGNGLLNMKHRMEQVNCLLNIISSPGYGCTIEASGTFY